MGNASALTGKLLIAMPFMQDTRFEQSVIYVCGNDRQGSIGLVLNKIMAQVTSESLLRQMGVSAQAHHAHFPIHYGGPVEPNRGFVLHDSSYETAATVSVGNGFCITTTGDVLRAIACGQGPVQYVTCLGYTGWAYGQLEREVHDNGWLVVDGRAELVFPKTPTTQWHQCMEALRVNPWALSPYSGRA
jgi:putative transcriptional regulator